ncbi:amidohydrolase [Silvimonas sp. JCM 19000]
MSELQVVDPHIHLWEISTHRYPWMEAEGEGYTGDISPIRRDYVVTDLLADAAAAGVVILDAVHIDANHDPADPVEETRWLQSLADAPGNHGLPGAIVAAADFSQPSADVEKLLAAHCQYRNVRGIRQILNVHRNPRFDYVGRHFMREPLWRSNFGLLSKYRLSFDLQLYPDQMPEAVELARQYPDISFIINHAGMLVDRGSVAGWRAWRDGLAQLATCANVQIKLSGFGMIDHGWTTESIRPYILQAIDSFGAERAMFASNFPVDRLYSDYGTVWRAYADCVADASAAEHAALFRDNARRIYRLE